MRNALAIAAALVLASTAGAGAQDFDGAQLSVTLITVGAGTDFFSWTGHSALKVDDAVTGQQRLFDYGMLPAGREAVHGLLTGDVISRIGVGDPTATLARWTADGRSIRRQPLALTAAQRSALWALLQRDQQPANRRYRYDFLRDNCTTRIRDLLDQVTHGALRRAGGRLEGHTIRQLGASYLPNGWLVAGFDLMLNGDVDRPLTAWDAALLPEGLSRLVAASVNDEMTGTPTLAPVPVTPLFQPDRSWLSGSPLNAGILSGLIAALVAAGAMVFASTGRKRAFYSGVWVALTGLILGLAGTILAAAWAFTSHGFARYNGNLLVVHPAWLACVPVGVAMARGSARARTIALRLTAAFLVLAIALLVMQLPGVVRQQSERTVLLLVPMIVLSVWLVATVPTSSRR